MGVEPLSSEHGVSLELLSDGEHEAAQMVKSMSSLMVSKHRAARVSIELLKWKSFTGIEPLNG